MGRPRSVWIFNHYASPPDQPAGTRHFDLARGLVARGFRVTIFAAGVSHRTGAETRLAGLRLFETQAVDGVRFVWLRTVPYRGNTWRRLANMLSYTLVASIVQFRFAPPSVVIGSTVHPFAAAAGLAVATVRRAPFVFEIRDLWPQTLVDMGALRPDSIVARLMWWLEAIMVRRAALVITVLPGMRAYLDSRRLRPRRLIHIPNGVRLEQRAAAPVPARVQDAIDGLHRQGAFVIGYLGAHGRANGLDVVMRAAAELRASGDSSIAVVLVGTGPEKSLLELTAKALGLANVTFLDPVEKAEVPAVVRLFDAGLLHLADVDVFRYGISPNKLFDYMAGERPVLFACRSGNNPVREAAAGLSIPPDDPSAMAAAMHALAGWSAEDLAAAGRAGRRHVAEHHDTIRLAARLGDELAVVIDAPR